MIRFLLVGLSLTAAPAALAQDYASEEQDLLFEDTYDLLSVIYFDTGWLPSYDPVGFQFYIYPYGGVVTEMEGTSHLEWPDALTHDISGVKEGGWFGLDTGFEMVAQIHFDIGVYEDTIPIWQQAWSFYEGVEFTGMLLPGSPQPSVTTVINDTGLIPPWEWSIDVVAGIIGFTIKLEIYPEFEATMSGQRVDTSHPGGLSSITTEGGTAQIDVPASDPSQVNLVSVYYAYLDAVFEMVIRPTLTVDTLLGDFDIASFDIPIPLLTFGDIRAFDPVAYTHPLPSVVPPPATIDFGEVLVGNLSNEQVPFENVGLMDAEGWVTVVGSEAFEVFPTYMHASPGNTDGLVVTFAPDAEGEDTALLVIETNDPLRPVMEVPLSGAGFVETSETDTDTVAFDDLYDEGYEAGLQDRSEYQTCGCASGAGSQLPWLGLGGLLLLARRRSP